MRSNIISLGQLSADQGSMIVLDGSLSWVHDKSGKLVMNIKRTPNMLYKIQLETCKPVCLAMSMDDPAWLWHERLGHVNF